MEPRSLPEKREGDNLVIPEPRFKIGEYVYYITAESPKGMITDLCYYPMLRMWKYNVGWDYVTADTYEEHELSETKNIM